MTSSSTLHRDRCSSSMSMPSSSPCASTTCVSRATSAHPLSVVYLGHVISVGSAAMDHEKGGGHHLLATTPLNAWPLHVPRVSGVLPPINLGLWHHRRPSNSTAQEGGLHMDSSVHDGLQQPQAGALHHPIPLTPRLLQALHGGLRHLRL